MSTAPDARAEAPALELMRRARTIAVVGVSSDVTRPAYEVAEYLIDVGYEVYLVNPTESGEVLGRLLYNSVAEIPQRIDIVDIFRRPGDVPPVVEDAIAAGAGAIWTQLEIVNEAAAERARSAGLAVVMDRCTKIDHGVLERDR